MSTEEFKVSGDDVVSFVKKIIKEGNARRIIIEDSAPTSDLGGIEESCYSS